jgi:NAD(P)-dependent dehydrogenase (short-subunit alcohol dehydrogenase family)
LLFAFSPEKAKGNHVPAILRRVILAGKTVVVCGAGGGLGREVARCALRDGANVVLGARTRARLEALAKELDPSGRRVASQVADATDPADCEALARAAAERFGSLDALVQVAALDAVFGGLAEADLEDWRRTYETNVIGSVQMIRAAVPHLERAGGGSVVLIGSQASLLPLVPQLAYAASKGALVSAMYHLAKELGRKRIRVNTVVPTWMWGPPVEGYLQAQAEQRGTTLEAQVREVTARMAIPEIPADEDVAEAVVFLASDRARMITGQSILVNAGELMR